MAKVFIAGGSGYVGRHLIPELLARGHEVIALVRAGSETKIPSGCRTVVGDALDGAGYRSAVSNEHTFVQLTGVAHPSPSKGREFETIDRRSAMEAIRVAREAGVRHFVYVSVAHPAPAMRAYIAARSACEEAIRESGLTATILRPWYVLGPGHVRPHVLRPIYWLAERLPATSEGAKRVGLITIRQMTAALAQAAERPPEGVRIVEVPEMRRL